MTNGTLKYSAVKQIFWLVALAICVIVYFLPYILYLSYLAGLPAAEVRKILNVDVDLAGDVLVRGLVRHDAPSIDIFGPAALTLTAAVCLNGAPSHNRARHWHSCSV